MVSPRCTTINEQVILSKLSFHKLNNEALIVKVCADELQEECTTEYSTSCTMEKVYHCKIEHEEQCDTTEREECRIEQQEECFRRVR